MALARSSRKRDESTYKNKEPLPTHVYIHGPHRWLLILTFPRLLPPRAPPSAAVAAAYVACGMSSNRIPYPGLMKLDTKNAADTARNNPSSAASPSKRYVLSLHIVILSFVA